MNNNNPSEASLMVFPQSSPRTQKTNDMRISHVTEPNIAIQLRVCELRIRASAHRPWLASRPPSVARLARNALSLGRERQILLIP
jgi:hypothetical protein